MIKKNEILGWKAPKYLYAMYANPLNIHARQLVYFDNWRIHPKLFYFTNIFMFNKKKETKFLKIVRL